MERDFVTTRRVVAVYLLLALAALVVAVARLSQSAEMPGLSAIELVILALPWSLALGVAPFTRLDMIGMTVIVLGGLALNAMLLGWLTARLARR